MRTRSTLIWRALFVLAATVLSALLSQPAYASSMVFNEYEADEQLGLVEMTPEARAFWNTQERLDRLAEDIRRAAPSRGATGLAGVVVHAARNTLELYWKGTVPAAVAADVDKARRNGTTVVVRSAPYTEERLLAEADRISRMPLFRGTRTGQRTMAVSPRPDGTGLDVGIYGFSESVGMTQARQLVPALQNSAVPLDVQPMGPVSLSSRAFMIGPYRGGGLIVRTATGYACSSAFGVTGNNGAACYLMTAAHCGEGEWGSPFYEDPDGQIRRLVYGATIPAGRATGRDVQLILPPAGGGASVYWGRGINPPSDTGTGTAVAVGGSSSNQFGNAVCFSGSFSGTICPNNGQEIRIRAVNITITYDPPTNGVGRVTNLVRVEHMLGGAIAGHGDSGGPMVSIRSDGKLSARGVIHAIELGQAERPCVGYSPPGRVCSMIAYAADLRSAMNVVGVRINTM